MPPLLVSQIAVALVWLYEGLWCKLLGGMPLQVDVVEAVPFFGRRAAGRMLRRLGVIECALAVWVLSGWRSVARGRGANGAARINELRRLVLGAHGSFPILPAWS